MEGRVCPNRLGQLRGIPWQKCNIVAPQRIRYAGPVLELRPNCECCDRDLPPASAEAMICTFECTFCADCAVTVLRGQCPNCGGNLVPRPIRPAHLLDRFPASTKRVLKAEGCAPVAA